MSLGECIDKTYLTLLLIIVDHTLCCLHARQSFLKNTEMLMVRITMISVFVCFGVCVCVCVCVHQKS